MQYIEVLPDHLLSHHIESYWFMPEFSSQKSPFELLLPTCTFNIIFINQPSFIKKNTAKTWVPIRPGAAFSGQRNTNILIKSKYPLRIFGIRLKPFAFANILRSPLLLLNDKTVPLEELFSVNKITSSLISQIIKAPNFTSKTPLLDDLMYLIFKNSMSIDETLRAQLNYIMDRKGLVKIGDLHEAFKVSKVTLRKHFINKVGLTPKKVAQIWRMNYILQLKKDNPNDNLTTLSFNAGFYDQAHFIKDFKLSFGVSPRKLFLQNSPLIKIAQYNISKRFTNQYDPQIIQSGSM